MADTNDMMNNIMGLLNNSEAKGKLIDAISALSSSGTHHEEKETDNNSVSSSSFDLPVQLGNDETFEAVMRIKNMLHRFNSTSDDRIGPLNAIKPYIRTGKKKNVDMAINFIKILNFSNSFKM